jgi:hypothetical protein
MSVIGAAGLFTNNHWNFLHIHIRLLLPKAGQQVHHPIVKNFVRQILELAGRAVGVL